MNNNNNNNKLCENDVCTIQLNGKLFKCGY